MAHIVAGCQHWVPPEPAQKMAGHATPPAMGSLKAASSAVQNLPSVVGTTVAVDLIGQNRKGNVARKAGFTKFEVHGREGQKTKEIAELNQFLKGGGDTGKKLLEKPANLCGHSLEMVFPTDSVPRMGKIIAWDEKKKLHKVEFTAIQAVLEIDLGKSRWLLSTEKRTELSGMEPRAIDIPDQNTPARMAAPKQAESPQENSHLLPNNLSETTHQGEDKNGIEKKKRSRKRPSKTAFEDQIEALPQLSHAMGLIPSKGRRPHKQGGCKTGCNMGMEALVGKRVHIWSYVDSVYAAGGVAGYDEEKGLHEVIYLDGQHEWLNMTQSIWRLGTIEHDNLYPENFERDVLGQHTNEDSGNDQSKEHGGRIGEHPTVSRNPEGRVPSSTNVAAEGMPPRSDHAPENEEAGGNMDVDRGDAEADTIPPTNITQEDTGGKKLGIKDGSSGGDLSAQPEALQAVLTSGQGIGKKLVASSMEFQVHKVNAPNSGYHVLCSVPPGTKITDVHVTCGNACIIIEHGENKGQEGGQHGNTSDRLIILLPEAIKPSSATAKLTQAGKLAVFTSLA